MFLWYIYWLFDSKNIMNAWFLNVSHWPLIGQACSIYSARKVAQINHSVFRHYAFMIYLPVVWLKKYHKYLILKCESLTSNRSGWFNLHGRKNRSDQSRPKCKAVKIRIITFMYYIHSIFIMGYNMGCYSLLNVCSSEIDKLLLWRNWSISNISEQKILLSSNNCIMQVLKGGFRLLYITPKGLIPYTQHLNMISSLEQEKVLLYKEKVQNKSFTFFKIIYIFQKKNHLHFCKFK